MHSDWGHMVVLPLKDVAADPKFEAVEASLLFLEPPASQSRIPILL
jgi:hypothetical protein